MMHIWTLENWAKYYDLPDQKLRIGLRTRFEADVDPEVKRACLSFCVWLRKNYFFPIRVPIYFKKSKYIKALDGELVSATFFGPYNKYAEPYIRIATGDYLRLLEKVGKDNALAAVLISIAHELTHYYQWINDLKLTALGEERQAKSYARFILDEYKTTRDHP